MTYCYAFHSASGEYYHILTGINHESVYDFIRWELPEVADAWISSGGKIENISYRYYNKIEIASYTDKEALENTVKNSIITRLEDLSTLRDLLAHLGGQRAEVWEDLEELDHIRGRLDDLWY